MGVKTAKCFKCHSRSVARFGDRCPRCMYGPGTFWFIPGDGFIPEVVGEAINSEFPEDMSLIENSRVNGYIFGAWYSVVTAEQMQSGYELGSNHASLCQEIEESDFLNILRSMGVTRRYGDKS